MLSVRLAGFQRMFVDNASEGGGLEGGDEMRLSIPMHWPDLPIIPQAALGTDRSYLPFLCSIRNGPKRW